MAVSEWAAACMLGDATAAGLLAALVVYSPKAEPDTQLSCAEWNERFPPRDIQDMAVAHLLETCRNVDRIVDRMLELRGEVY
jgi:hypothetical protein